MTSVDLFEMMGLLDELKVHIVIEEPWYYFDHSNWIQEVCKYDIFTGFARSLSESEDEEFYPTYIYNM